jgi:hypothetical protein
VRFNSGLGEFELTVERVEVRGDQYVLVGKMGVWDSETIMEPEELVGLYLKSARPGITLYFLRLPFLLVRRWLQRRRRPAAAAALARGGRPPGRLRLSGAPVGAFRPTAIGAFALTTTG